MSKNQIQTKLPAGNQLQPQSQGNVQYKVKVEDTIEEGAQPQLLRGLLGKGGGGGGSPGGHINGDVMHTDTYAKFIDIISEGPIEGPVNIANPVGSILLNGTPLADEGGNLNFKGVQVYQMLGTEDQRFPPMFQKSGSTISVNAQIKKAIPHTITIADDQITSVNIIIRLPSLASIDNNGNVNGTSVALQFSINGNVIAKKTISGIATSSIEKSFLFNILPYEKEVTMVIDRVTDDSSNPGKLQNDTYIASYTNIIDYAMNYANRAGAALMFEAAQFGTQLPDRAYHIKGINAIKIPENYNPVTRKYIGIWNGVFTTAYTNNPVWCMLDLMTNKRYGAGDSIDVEQIDKFELYTLAQYCDDLVPGLGGNLEPRFTFNIAITDREQALTIFKKMQNNFLSVLYYFGGVIKLTQDSPSEAIAIVTNANVLEEGFNYSSIELDRQSNTVIVSYNEPLNNYSLTTETVYNNKLLNEVGVEVKKELYAFGCTSRSQAHRLGKYQLLSDVLNSETVTYTAGLDHSSINVGEVIEIHDNNMPNSISGGRLVSMTDLIIVLDRDVTLLAGVTYFISILDQNGIVQKLTIDPSNIGSINTITVVDSKGFKANPYAIYGISNSTDSTGELYRVVDIKENDSNKYDITANKYDASKYDLIYTNNPIDISPDQKLPDVKSPTNLLVSNRTLFKNGKSVLNNTSFSWNKVNQATHYEYQYRIDSSEFSAIKTTDDNSIAIIDSDGVYDIRVRSSDLLNRKSTFIENKFRISTSDVIPAQVQTFVIHRSGVALIFTWKEVPIDEYGLIAYYEIRQGSTWSEALTIFTTLNNSYTYTLNTGGTFLIKAISIAGIESTTATSALAFSGNTNTLGVADNYASDGFPLGTLSNFVVETESFNYSDSVPFIFSNAESFDFTSSAGNRLELQSFNYDTWNTVTQQWNTLTTPWVSSPTIGLLGSYETPVKDLGEVLNVYVKAEASKTFNDNGIYWTDIGDLYWTDMNDWYWTGKTEVSSMKVFMRNSQDNTTFTDYTELVPGQYSARYFQYKITLKALAPAYDMFVDSFLVQYDIPSTTETDRATTDGTGLVTITFKDKYTQVPSVVATPEALTSNSICRLVSASTTQAIITTLDTISGVVAPNTAINVQITGY
tara:strand:+ start:4299 stop:7700 length:3402 start_codon:yes stop_codon:yes gene_type:complete